MRFNLMTKQEMVQELREGNEPLTQEDRQIIANIVYRYIHYENAMETIRETIASAERL